MPRGERAFCITTPRQNSHCLLRIKNEAKIIGFPSLSGSDVFLPDANFMSEPTSDDILKAIPHRKPMLLVDQILERDEKKILCTKTFVQDEFFVQGHFPGHPLVPGVILCECCMQAGAILLSQYGTNEGSLPVATRMDSVKFKKMVRPGDTVQIEAVLNEKVSNAFFLTGKVTIDGKLAARLDFACSLTAPPGT